MATPFNFLTEAGLGGYKQGRGRVIVPGGSVDDPYNWKQIAADLAAEEKRKRQAQSRIRNPTAPRAVAQAAPKAFFEDDPSIPAFSPNGGLKADFIDGIQHYADGYTFAPDGWRNEKGEKFTPATPTIKQLLDAYRAMNNGALPEGTSPEMAAMIDKGIWSDWSMLQGNPQLAQALLSIQGAITGLPAQYQAAKQGILGNYSGITGAIVNPASAWGQSMTGAMTSDPFNPNAALAGADPALVDYNNTISAISGTAGLNQATDLSWFDKMLQNQLSNYEFMMRSAALPVPVEAEEDGGGGGGGGGGRGGGGGGGGSGSWSKPKTTIGTEEEYKEVDQGQYTQFNPDFLSGILAKAREEGGPELEAFVHRVWQESNQTPQGMTMHAAGKLGEAELMNKADIQQLAGRVGWEESVPNLVTAAKQAGINARGAVAGDDPTTVRVERYISPPSDTNVPAPVDWTPEQQAAIDLADKLFETEIAPPTQWPSNRAATQGGAYIPDKDTPAIDIGAPSARQWGGQVAKYHGGFMPTADRLERDVARAIERGQKLTMEDVGHAALTEAKKGYGTGNEFDMASWIDRGGWVPDINKEEVEAGTKNVDWLAKALGFIETYNPNANLVQTRGQFTTTDTDMADVKSSSTRYGYPTALPGSPRDITPEIPAYAYQTSPLLNPNAFNVDDNGNPIFEEGYDDYNPSDVFGESRGLSRGASPTSARLAAIAKESIRQRREGSRRPKAAIEAEEMKAVAARKPTKKAAPKKATPSKSGIDTVRENLFGPSPVIPRTSRTPRTVAALSAADIKTAAAKKLKSKEPKKPKKSSNTRVTSRTG